MQSITAVKDAGGSNSPAARSARAGSTSGSSMPNRKKFSSPTHSRISTLAPSSVPMIRQPFIWNFMLDVPEASVPAVEMCCDSSEAGMSVSARDTL